MVISPNRMSTILLSRMYPSGTHPRNEFNVINVALMRSGLVLAVSTIRHSSCTDANCSLKLPFISFVFATYES